MDAILTTWKTLLNSLPLSYLFHLSGSWILQKEDWEPIYEMFHGNWDFPELTDEQKQKLAFQYCNGVIGIGESSQSSSPLDPTFWSLHPTMERLYM